MPLRRRNSRLSAADRELVAAARAVIRRGFIREKHHVGAALRTGAGKIFTGLHLEPYVGRLAVCAEAGAISAAAVAGERTIESIVAARYTGQVISPCGGCRELIADFAPRARVIVPGPKGLRAVPIARLLPKKCRKSH